MNRAYHFRIASVLVFSDRPSGFKFALSSTCAMMPALGHWPSGGLAWRSCRLLGRPCDEGIVVEYRWLEPCERASAPLIRAGAGARTTLLRNVTFCPFLTVGLLTYVVTIE